MCWGIQACVGLVYESRVEGEGLGRVDQVGAAVVPAGDLAFVSVTAAVIDTDMDDTC